MSDQGSLLAGYLMPHPPVIVPGVDSGRVKAGQTIQAMQQLALDLAKLKPDTVVLISPHAPLFSDYLFVYDEQVLYGDLSAFGAPEARLSLHQDQELLEGILQGCQKLGIAAGSLNASQMGRFNIDRSLDHGAVVPLYFLQQKASFQLVVMASAALPLPDLYAVGRAIREAAETLGRRIVLVASGDQSHKANSESPYGSCPEGAVYDRKLVEALRRGDRTGLLAIDARIRQKAAECGYRAAVMLCGAFAGLPIQSDLLSYEAPYGIGYCVARIVPDPSGAPPLVDPLQSARLYWQETISQEKRSASSPVQIARQTIEKIVRRHRQPDPEAFAELVQADPWLKNSAGVFVSLKKHGELRGCIGTTVATTASLVEEIIQNAISAATGDPRFEPVQADELSELSVSVDVLGAAEPITSRAQLDPKKYGVIVRSGTKTGLLLPDLEGVDSVEEQLAIACRKAGIRPDEPYRIERFRVDRYT